MSAPKINATGSIVGGVGGVGEPLVDIEMDAAVRDIELEGAIGRRHCFPNRRDIE